MNPGAMISLILGVIIIVFAVLAMELKNITYAILSLCGFSVAVAVAFFFLNAPYVAVFQLAILAGAVTVLFLVAVMLTRKEEVELP